MAAKVKELARLADNKSCFDCKKPGVQNNVNLTQSTFVCTSCAGLHRNFSHKIKTINMSSFSPSEVASLKEGGNKKARAIWLGRYNPKEHPVDTGNPNSVKTFMDQVYKEKLFYLKPGSEAPKFTKKSDKESKKKKHERDKDRKQENKHRDKNPEEGNDHGKGKKSKSEKGGKEKKQSLEDFIADGNSDDTSSDDGSIDTESCTEEEQEDEKRTKKSRSTTKKRKKEKIAKSKKSSRRSSVDVDSDEETPPPRESRRRQRRRSSATSGSPLGSDDSPMRQNVNKSPTVRRRASSSLNSFSVSPTKSPHGTPHQSFASIDFDQKTLGSDLSFSANQNPNSNAFSGNGFNNFNLSNDDVRKNNHDSTNNFGASISNFSSHHSNFNENRFNSNGNHGAVTHQVAARGEVVDTLVQQLQQVVNRFQLTSQQFELCCRQAVSQLPDDSSVNSSASTPAAAPTTTPSSGTSRSSSGGFYHRASVSEVNLLASLFGGSAPSPSHSLRILTPTANQARSSTTFDFSTVPTPKSSSAANFPSSFTPPAAPPTEPAVKVAKPLFPRTTTTALAAPPSALSADPVAIPHSTPGNPFAALLAVKSATAAPSAKDLFNPPVPKKTHSNAASLFGVG